MYCGRIPRAHQPAQHWQPCPIPPESATLSDREIVRSDIHRLLWYAIPPTLSTTSIQLTRPSSGVTQSLPMVQTLLNPTAILASIKQLPVSTLRRGITVRGLSIIHRDRVVLWAMCLAGTIFTLCLSVCL